MSLISSSKNLCVLTSSSLSSFVSIVVKSMRGQVGFQSFGSHCAYYEVSVGLSGQELENRRNVEEYAIPIATVT